MSDKPRREWTLLNKSDGSPGVWEGPSLGPSEFARVREVLPGSREITREEIRAKVKEQWGYEWDDQAQDFLECFERALFGAEDEEKR